MAQSNRRPVQFGVASLLVVFAVLAVALSQPLLFLGVVTILFPAVLTMGLISVAENLIRNGEEFPSTLALLVAGLILVYVVFGIYITFAGSAAN